MEDFTLSAVDFAASPSRVTWRWSLTRPGGSFISDHEVNLDKAEWQYEACTDLYGWLEHYAGPFNDRTVSEERIVAAVGDWISQRLFGAMAGILVAHAPCSVRLVLAPAAADLAYLPLELARVGGRPLGVERVSLVIDVGAPRDPSRSGGIAVGPWERPTGHPVRVLGLFSLPHGSVALNLRKERHELERLVEELTGSGRAIELRTLQYGATREELAGAVAEGGGWDVVHLSGHGRAGLFMLERLDGSRDPVTGDELTELLSPLRGRVKLVMLSSCDSGERIARRQLEVLAGPGEAASGEGDGSDDADMVGANTALAADLARRLDCAVVGMRYPVAESFAAAFAGELYRLLFMKGLPLATARAAATTATAAGHATFDRPALSPGVPALYAASAIDLRLAAPRVDAPVTFTRDAVKLAGLPIQPVHFVGRVAAMSRVSQALAPRSGYSGVVIHGMAGAGKTALALEATYTQQENFRAIIWYAAPSEGADVRSAVIELAAIMEQEIPGLEFIHLLNDTTRLRAFLPRLTELFRRRRILLVIDNADSLLSAAGNWRDERWQLVINALTSHAGLGRLIITTRYPVLVTGSGTVLAEPLDTLSGTEAVLLAREFPRLRALLDGAAPLLNEASARSLARRVLNAVHGHPKLLELAEEQAAEPAELARTVLIADQAWREHRATATAPDAGDTAGYLAALDAWTRQVYQRMDPPAQLIFSVLCSLEPDDREQGTVQDVWPHLWQRLAGPGDPPVVNPEMVTLAARGLIRVERHEVADGPANSDFVVHPAVAAAGRALAGAQLRHHVDRVLGDYWRSLFVQALDQEADEGYGWLLLYAGRAALPYLIRLGDWERARYLIQEILHRDDSPATAAALVPALRTMAAASDSDSAMRTGHLLARALESVDVQAAEQELRTLLSAAVGAGDHRTASVLAGDLSDILLDAGQLYSALTASEEKVDYTQRAGLGPWSVIGAQAHRLRVLAIQGKTDEVFAGVRQLRAQMNHLAETAQADETAVPWSVREVVLDLGREAACLLQRWDDALALSAETARSQRQRSAPLTELCRTLFNDYYPLLKLGRLAEAREVLYQCRATAEDARDIAAVGKILGALADVEDALGHGDVALDLDGAALRYKYLANDADGIAASHHNYGSHTARYRGQVVTGQAHILAAALIRMLTGTDGLELALRAAALLASELPPGSSPPGDTRQLCEVVDEVPGVDLSTFLARLEPTASRLDEAYRQVLTQVPG